MDRGNDALVASPKKILAKNIGRLKEAFPEVYASQAKAGKAAGVSQSTIDRLEAGETDTRISTVAGVASAFGFAGWQLLIPDFDPKDPPVLALTPEERRVIRALRGND